MKKVIVFVTLMTSLIFYGQEKLEFIDYNDILEKIDVLSEKEEYDKIIEHLEKININDSLYESSLVTKSYYLLKKDAYQEAIKVSDIGLKINNGTNRYSFLLNKGVAFLRSERYQEALTVCNDAIREYPKNYVLFYNRGIIHERLEMFDKAIKDYIEAIKLNPFYANAHLQLGKICLKEGRTGQAMMAINMYLLLNPEGSDSFSILNSINVAVSNKSEIKPKGIRISPDDNAFEDMDLILNNRIALNPSYKIDNKINIALTKQNHALFEQLDDFDGNNGFWDRKYVPFYKWVFSSGYFDDFTYTIAYTIENKDFKKIVGKNIDKIKAFINLFYDKWAAIMSTRNQQLLEGKKQEVSYVYDDYTLRAFGKTKDDKRIGNWLIFNDQGKLKGSGKFNEKGERVDKWIWYDDYGNKSIIEQYVGGKLEGEFLSFHDNKNPKVVCNYKAGKLNGLYEKYNKKGALIEEKSFSEDQLDGSYKSYYALGASAQEYALKYKKGNPEGELLQYHPNGKLYKKRNYRNGVLEGKEQKFYKNEILQSEFDYSKGVINGPYTTYHKNGTKYEVGTSTEGKYNGNVKLYYNDGTILNDYTYTKGKLNGLYKEYDVDGKLYYEFVYRNDEFIEYRYFDKEGNSIIEGKKKKGEFYYKGYSSLGDLETEGMYDVKGGKKDVWKYYENGVLISKGIYTDNKLNGKYHEFYKSGQKESIIEYKNDSLTGYYVAYHKNGNISNQGWHKDNANHGTWVSYYDDGRIKQKSFYHKGLEHGKQEFFGVEGKLFYESYYEFGDLIAEKYYTSSGEILEKIEHDPNKKEYTVSLKQYNGNTYSTTEYLHTIKHGKYIRYNASGKKNLEGSYFNGKYHGEWIWYHDNGQVSTKGTYFHGDYIGEWKTYFKNGKVKETYSYQSGELNGPNKKYSEEGVLTAVVPYKNNKLHGQRIFYSPEGKLQLVRFYHNDKIIGYSYNDKNGTLKPMIPLKNYTGMVHGFFDNGKPSIQMEYKNGFFVNEYKAYYYSGQLERHTVYKDGDTHGKYTFYYPSGKVKKEMNYRHDALHGLYKEYYPNGTSKEEINYQHDSRSGIAKYYDENGKLIKEQSYFNDLLEK
ncbi:tetratricopeptide repeat protein [Aquimarina sp. 2201CG1-2-11]|uniref:tetratricopeptide repeat protein n=1 Tax=Aquimarina discodermiae TaxID=3231043 RepID=UPI0034636B50